LAAVLCLLGLSGVWIYRDFWANFTRLRWRASRQIFLSDLHKTAGITSVVFNLILGFTGAYWNKIKTVNGAGPPSLTITSRFANCHAPLQVALRFRLVTLAGGVESMECP